ncbi:unnamed protein product [Dibothriocephalus latus]|uniref:Uncharacterized protein n=1 Tax=Dibothriocephalus latus TaxID=60516 RepID=A0A3P6UW54_DIBLA|nr:unnamed protein product [Dibothriocephalus latus]
MWRWLSRFSGDRGPPEDQQRSRTLPRHASESPSPNSWRDGPDRQRKANTMDNAHEEDGAVNSTTTPQKRSRFAFLRPRRGRTLSFSRNASKPREGKKSLDGFASPITSTHSSPARQVSGQKSQISERPVKHDLPPVDSSQPSSSASTLSDKDITPTTEEPRAFKTLEKKSADGPRLPSEEEESKRNPPTSKKRAKRPHSPASPPPQSPSSSSGRPSRRDAKSRTLTKPSFLHFTKQSPVCDPLTYKIITHLEERSAQLNSFGAFCYNSSSKVKSFTPLYAPLRGMNRGSAEAADQRPPFLLYAKRVFCMLV